MSNLGSSKRLINYNDVQQGLREIYPAGSAGALPKIDIVFVPGLGAHPERSWASAKTGFNWASDVEGGLPAAYQDSRVLLYEYESAWIGVIKVQQFVDNVAMTLLQHLQVKREAVEISNRRRDKFSSMFETFAGCVFFGTPFRGAEAASVAAMIADIGEKLGKARASKLLDLMKPDSSELYELTNEFTRLTDDTGPRVEVQCFYEQRPTEYSVITGLKIINLLNIFVPRRDLELVTRQSACIDGRDNLGLAKNHRDLVKFDSPGDDSYLVVKALISRILNRAEEVVQARLNSAQRNIEASKAIVQIPFPQIEGFIGRQSECKELEKALFRSGGSRYAAICGLGGIGKTRLALELSYRWRERDPGLSIFWVQGTNNASFENDYLVLGKRLGIQGVENAKVDANIIVKQRLSHATGEKWIMILDNADDTDLWLQNPENGASGDVNCLAEYLPSNPNGSILVTTRTRSIAVALCGKHFVDLDQLKPAEAVLMLQVLLKDQAALLDDKETAMLLERLSYLPLAISQAASFLNETGQTIKKYLSLLDDSEKGDIGLLSRHFEDKGRYRDSVNPIASTWLITFDHIRKQNKLASEYLLISACLHERAIPELIWPSTGSSLKQVDAVAILEGYSFLKRRMGDPDMKIQLYDMHRLVRLVARNWMEKNNTLAAWTQTSIKQMADIFPTNDDENRWLWRLLMPHAQILEHSNECPQLRDRYVMLESMFHCLMKDGHYADAVQISSHLVHWSAKEFGDSNEVTWKACSNYGRALSEEGRNSDALNILLKAFNAQTEKLGEDHVDTLTTMRSLALAHRRHGNYREAMRLYEQGLVLTEYEGPLNEVERMDWQLELSVAYIDLGLYDKAEQIVQDILETRIAHLGSNHNATLQAFQVLAGILADKGTHQEAEKIYVSSVKKRESVLGPEHPDTLMTMGNLAVTMRLQGRHKKAEELEKKVLELRSKILGAEHPATLTAMGNLTVTMRLQGRYKEAEELAKKVLELQSKILGAEHPDTLRSMHNLAVTWHKLGYLKKAMDMMEETSKLCEKGLGPEHPYTKASMEWLEFMKNEYAETLAQNKQPERGGMRALVGRMFRPSKGGQKATRAEEGNERT